MHSFMISLDECLLCDHELLNQIFVFGCIGLCCYVWSLLLCVEILFFVLFFASGCAIHSCVNGILFYIHVYLFLQIAVIKMCFAAKIHVTKVLL